MDTRPFRSVLYIPGSKERALHKATTLPTDAIIFDLEDAVAIDEETPRAPLAGRHAASAGLWPARKLVRINDLGTEWGADDLDEIAAPGPKRSCCPRSTARRMSRIWPVVWTPVPKPPTPASGR